MPDMYSFLNILLCPARHAGLNFKPALRNQGEYLTFYLGDPRLQHL
jgi:hypothetical protein